MKKLFIILLLSASFTTIMSQTSSLFFSEYCEGSSNNKYIELYNASNSMIMLSDYSILTNFNGGSWSGMHSFPPGSTLAPNDVWIIANSSADAAILNAADEIFPYNASGYIVGFNGDDVRALVQIIGADTNILDIIGRYDLVDPGNGWEVAGVADGTKEHTLVRKPDVCFGNPDWDAAAGTNATDSEWIVNPQDDFSDLGTHTSNCVGPVVDTIPPVVADAYATSLTELTLVFNEEVDNTAIDPTNYTGLGSIGIIDWSPSHDSVFIVLTVPLQICVYDTLTIDNVSDTAGNVMSASQDVYVIFGCQPAEIVITEIMYNPPEGGNDSLEFIELYNNGADAVDLNGYYFSQGVTYTFPSTIMNPGEFIVVCVNATAFQNIFGVQAFEWSGALSNGGEDIELSDDQGNVIDYVEYSDKTPWDTLADGAGPSLTLCDPSSDNSLPANWKASIKFAAVNADGDSIFATPGAACMTVGYEDLSKATISPEVYPNPSTGDFFIIMPDDGHYEVSLYSILGKRVYNTISNERKLSINLDDRLSGVYFLNVYDKTRGKLFSEKLVIKH
jgi:hypothetical protein